MKKKTSKKNQQQIANANAEVYKAAKMNHALEKLITFEELSELTGMSVPFLRKARTQLGLPHYKLGHLVKFRISEVELWIRQRKAK